VDLRTPPAQTGPLALVQSFGELVLEVSDTDRARRFYADLLGFERDGQADEGPRLSINAEQSIVLVHRSEPKTLPESGVHWAFRFTPGELAALVQRLDSAGVVVHRYHEDCRSERDQNRYLVDPDGNRLQLVASPVGEDPDNSELGTRNSKLQTRTPKLPAAIDHVALETHDLEWGEVFYTTILGGCVEERVGWRMDDYEVANEWGAGRDDCAPGTRRWDKRYTTVEEQAALPRPNAHIFVRLAPDVVVGFYLATEHRQESPPDQFLGTPRLGFTASSGRLCEIEERLRETRLRPMHNSEQTGAPFERANGALYLKDPGGNFLEIKEAS
jgi:catechol-2,3-dioxygenase